MPYSLRDKRKRGGELTLQEHDQRLRDNHQMMACTHSGCGKWRDVKTLRLEERPARDKFTCDHVLGPNGCLQSHAEEDNVWQKDPAFSDQFEHVELRDFASQPYCENALTQLQWLLEEWDCWRSFHEKQEDPLDLHHLQDPATLELLKEGPERVSRLHDILQKIIQRILPQKWLDQQAAERMKGTLKQKLPDEKEAYRIGRRIEELIDWPDKSDLKRRAPQSSQEGGSAQRTRAHRALPSNANDSSREAAGDERREGNGKDEGREEGVVLAASMEVAGESACTLSAGAGGAAKDGAGKGKEPEDDGNMDMELTVAAAQMQRPSLHSPSESERASGSAGGVDLESAGGTGVSTQRDVENRPADGMSSTNTAGVSRVSQGGEERSDVFRKGEGGGGNALPQASSKVTFTMRVSELEMKVLGNTKESLAKKMALIQRLTELEAAFDMQENAKLSIPTRVAALEEVV